MKDLPDWEIAIERFKDFLTSENHPSSIIWIFKNDIWHIDHKRALVKWPVSCNLDLCKNVYNQGISKGLVSVHAIAKVNNYTLATVWYPKYPEDEIQGWDQNLKLSISEPLLMAEKVSKLKWILFHFDPWFHHYQKHCSFIGSKKWARS